MTGSPVDVGTQDLLRYGSGGRAFLHTLVAAIVTLVLACFLTVVGFWLATYDAQRSHIPGHWLFRALAVAPAIVQLAYVVPVRRAFLARGHVMIARGILVGAVAAIILNLAIVGIAAWMTRGFD
jgi:heme/copper-type cytochrome/quinol oxidase subunit 4